MGSGRVSGSQVGFLSTGTTNLAWEIEGYILRGDGKGAGFLFELPSNRFAPHQPPSCRIDRFRAAELNEE